MASLEAPAVSATMRSVYRDLYLSTTTLARGMDAVMPVREGHYRCLFEINERGETKASIEIFAAARHLRRYAERHPFSLTAENLGNARVVDG